MVEVMEKFERLTACLESSGPVLGIDIARLTDCLDGSVLIENCGEAVTAVDPVVDLLVGTIGMENKFDTM